MSDNEHSNDRIDSFSEYFRQRLINKPTPPDENCWNEIKVRLAKRRAISPAWIGLAIAASVMMVFFILNNTKNDREHPENHPVSELNEVIVDKETTGDNIIPGEEHADENSENTPNILFAEAKVKRKTPTIAPVVKKEATSAKEEQGNRERDEAENKIKENIAADTNTVKGKAVTNGKTKTDDFVKNAGTTRNNDHNRPKRRDHNWQLQAGLNSIGRDVGTSNEGSMPDGLVDQPKLPSIGFGEWDSWTSTGISKERITDKTYSTPLSIGITVRKRLTRTLGLETGLVYTNLSTSFAVNEPQYYTANLKLHYIGVPANLIVNLRDKRSWNMYVFGGGMVEKGLQAVFTRRGALNHKGKSSIPGLQWSMHGGFGASYNFFKDMSLFFEPGFSYYFDCDQPMSRRTEEPFMFNLRVGLRYDFR